VGNNVFIKMKILSILALGIAVAEGRRRRRTTTTSEEGCSLEEVDNGSNSLRVRHHPKPKGQGDRWGGGHQGKW
jgi:hypothetical protein